METGIGATLREARNRRKIAIAEVEAATKIRARYLRAMENEEWEMLPGDSYTYGFIRTYSSFLGLDGERLAAEYRLSVGGEDASERGPHAEPLHPLRPRRRWPTPSARAWTAIVSVAFVLALVAIEISGGGHGSAPTGPFRASDRHLAQRRDNAGPPRPRTVSVRLAATAEVWVCLLDATGKRLVDGVILGPGARAGPFHSASFMVSFGNGEVLMKIDGQKASIPATASPIGFSIDSSGRLQRLPESQRPSCT